MGERSIEAFNRLNLDDFLDKEGFIEGNGEVNKGKKYHIINSKSTNFENGVSIGKNSRPAVLCEWDEYLNWFYEEIMQIYDREEKDKLVELSKFKGDETINMIGVKEALFSKQKESNIIDLMEFLSDYIFEYKRYDSYEYSKDIKKKKFDIFKKDYGIVGKEDILVPISHFVKNRKLVCLHSSLLNAMILERYQKEKNIDGKIHAVRYSHPIYAHMVVIYENKDYDHIYSLDSVQENYARLAKIDKKDFKDFKKVFKLDF